MADWKLAKHLTANEDEIEALRVALRLALNTLGACHSVVEGPNAGWRDDMEWYDEDFVPAPDCVVCKVQAVAREALGETLALNQQRQPEEGAP
jgi:Zn ribbon nucleic-acid-binding protein